jgi:hypothetical protein
MTGYLVYFYLYKGKCESRPSNIPATAFPVYELFCKWPEDFNCNFILCTDNWYTSLFNLLQVTSTGNHYVGTSKTNKIGLPNGKKGTIDATFPKAGKNKKERGAHQQAKANVTPRAETPTWAYFISWQDNKPVHLLSTIASTLGTCTRMVSVAGRWVRMTIARPTMVQCYNLWMKGTDLIDQLMSYFRPEIRAKTWLPRIFSNCLRAAAVNSFIVYN